MSEAFFLETQTVNTCAHVSIILENGASASSRTCGEASEITVMDSEDVVPETGHSTEDDGSNNGSNPL